MLTTHDCCRESKLLHRSAITNSSQIEIDSGLPRGVLETAEYGRGCREIAWVGYASILIRGEERSGMIDTSINAELFPFHTIWVNVTQQEAQRYMHSLCHQVTLIS